MARDFEKEIQDRVETSASQQERQGVVEQLEEKIYCLTNIVAHLTQVLVDRQVLTARELLNL